MLKSSLQRTRVKLSQSLESMLQYIETYWEYDPFMFTQTPNPWTSDDHLGYFQLSAPL